MQEWNGSKFQKGHFTASEGKRTAQHPCSNMSFEEGDAYECSMQKVVRLGPACIGENENWEH